MDTIDEQDQKEANTLRTWPPIEISFDKICYTVETAKGNYLSHLLKCLIIIQKLFKVKKTY